MWFRFHTELANVAVSFQVFQFYSEVCSTKTALRTRRERGGASHTSLTYNLVSSLCSLKELFFFVWQFTIIIGISSFEHYPFLGIALMTRPVPVLLAFITVSYTIGYMALPQNEACLRHYLDTLMRTDERVIATNIRLKTSNDIALVSRGRPIKCVLRDLYYVSNSIAKRLADDCHCMLVLWHIVSSGSAFCLV